MPEQDLTIIDDGNIRTVRFTTDRDRVRLSPQALQQALGWELKPQGFCKGALCVPAGGRAGLVTDDGIELGAFAALLGRPLSLDVEERAAYLGVASSDRSAQLASLEAPDFTLPDLEGRSHSL